MNERQQQLLDLVVGEYIKRANPISSGFLAENYDLGVSPATIRNDLAALLAEGYLKKIHFSSGSVPTNLAYRFLVDQVLRVQARRSFVQKLSDRRFVSLAELAQYLADRSRLLSLVVDEDFEVALNGIDYLFSQPDFGTFQELQALAVFLDSLLEMRQEIFKNFYCAEPEVYIGRENPLFSENEDLAWVTCFGKNRQGKDLGLFLIGPTRMAYEKNLNLLKRLVDIN